MPKCDLSQKGRRRTGAIKALLALALTGCAGTEYFRPTEKVTALSPEGYAAADYPVIIHGNAVADIKVWSGGASRQRFEDGEKHTVVRVGFGIENNGKDPVWLDTEGMALDAESHGRVI